MNVKEHALSRTEMKEIMAGSCEKTNTAICYCCDGQIREACANPEYDDLYQVCFNVCGCASHANWGMSQWCCSQGSA